MEEKILKNYIEDQIQKAIKSGIGITKFLTPQEQIEVISHINHYKYNQKVDIIKDGGYNGAERVRMIFINKQWGEFKRDEILGAIVIEHRNKII